jgi:DNA-binding transcriptional regulator GbsR (MarR family)
VFELDLTKTLIGLQIVAKTFSSKLNKEFTSAHPNIFYFIETLNSIQTLNDIKLQSNNTRKLTSKQERNNKRLENCMTENINEKLITHVNVHF